MGAVADHLLTYGETDLLCYRAEDPRELAERQAEAWDPWLDWAADALGARLRPTAGILPIDQDTGALSNLRDAIGKFDAFELTAFHDLVTLTGSLILGFAAERGAAPVNEIWQLARLDEEWQIAMWGSDDEAEEAAQRRLNDLTEAMNFLALTREA